MAKGFCSYCEVELTLENASGDRLTHGGPCKSCRREDYKKNTLFHRQRDKERYWKNREHRQAINKRSRLKNKDGISVRSKIRYQNNIEIYKTEIRSFKGRHKTLLSFLRKEGVAVSDLLWSLNFYSELIRISECHYCSGPLNETGAGLDRISNDVGHICYNVVPCCRKCNRIKGNDTSYEEMMLLAPILKEIRSKKFESDSSVKSLQEGDTHVVLL